MDNNQTYLWANLHCYFSVMVKWLRSSEEYVVPFLSICDGVLQVRMQLITKRGFSLLSFLLCYQLRRCPILFDTKKAVNRQLDALKNFVLINNLIENSKPNWIAG